MGYSLSHFIFIKVLATAPPAKNPSLGIGGYFT